MKIAGQVCYVSGAAQGIGLEVAKRLVEGGGQVLLVDVCKTARGEKIAAELNQSGRGKAVFFRADLGKAEDVMASFHKPKEVFGAAATIVCNNAGIVVNDGDARVRTMFDVNSIYQVEGTQIAADLMKQQKTPGVIINTASTAGVFIVPSTPAYAGSKAAVVNYVSSCVFMPKTHNVRVNAICPVLVDTPAVGAHFKDIFRKDGNNPTTQAMLNNPLTPAVVADAFMKIIDDEKLNATCVMVMTDRTVLYRPDMQRITMDIMKAPEYVPRVKSNI